MGTTVSALQIEEPTRDPIISDDTQPDSSLVQNAPGEDPDDDVEPSEMALRNRKQDEIVQRDFIQSQSAQNITSSELMLEHEKEVAMGKMASNFLPRRHFGKNPFKYDEFESLRRAYNRDIIAKQMGNILRSQNQAKLDKEEALASFSRIHKAISELEGWGPGLRLSCRERDWVITGISKNSGASVSGIRLNDKLVSVDSHAVSGKTFEELRSLLLGPKDSSVIVVVSNRKFLWSVDQAYVLVRNLASASFNFSSQEVVRRTLRYEEVVEIKEMEGKLEEQTKQDILKQALLAAEAARAAEQSAILNLQYEFVSAPPLSASSTSLVHNTITDHIKNMGIPSFVISIHDRSLSKEFNSLSTQLADSLSILMRSFSVEPVVNIINSYHQKGLMTKSLWRSSIEQGASTNGFPVCILIWDLNQWKIWEQWMNRHHKIMVESHRSIDAYRRQLLNFDDEDIIQEAVHIFSAKEASQVSRIFVLVKDDIPPSSLVDLVDMNLMQTLFQTKLPQVIFIYRNSVRIELSTLQIISYTSITSMFEKSDIAHMHYYFNLLTLVLGSVSRQVHSVYSCGPDIRKILCSGKSVITSKFIPNKRAHFSPQDLAESYEMVLQQHKLKQPQHFVLHRIIHDWPNNPMSAMPGKKLFFFTPESSGFSSVLDWIHSSLKATPVGLEDIIPILVRVPKYFHESGLAESKSLIFALHTCVKQTLSAPPFNFVFSANSGMNFSADSPEFLMESLAKILSVACKQLSVKFLIMVDNIHYINFDSDSIGCMQWTFSRMPQNVRIVFPFLLRSPIQMSLKTHVDSIQGKVPAGSLDIEFWEDLEYRQIPVFPSHQREFFGCFVKSGTACQVIAEKLCEDYFALYLHVNPNMDSHIWLLITAGYFMIHHLWNLGVKPIDILLSSNLKPLIFVIVQDFATVLTGTTMLTVVRILNAAKYGITLTELIKIMMVSNGHRDLVFQQKCEYHHSCRTLFDSPGQAQAVQRFCCIFARMEGDGFSTSSLLLLNEHVGQLLEQVIFGLNGPLAEVPSIEYLKCIIFEFLEFSCNIETSSGSLKGTKESHSIQGGIDAIGNSNNPSQLRHLIIMTDFALHMKNKSVFLSALNSIKFVHARMVTGCVHWVVGNILQALRRVDLFDESEMSTVSLIFRSLISHKSRVPLLEIQPDLYFSIMSTIPSKELICRQTSDILEKSHEPWLRHSNKQQYFQSPVIDLGDLPFAATAVSTSKRGHFVAAGDFSGKLAAWRVSSSDLLCIFSSHLHAITGLAFSALDYIIISSSSDCSININSVYSSSVLSTISPFSQPASCLDVWLKDSDTFASVSRDGLAAIITLNLRSIAGRSSAWKAVRYNQRSDFTDEELGALLLEPASSVFTFQVASFAVLAQNVHTNFVDCISCHPSDKTIFATGSRDTSIFVWKVDVVNCSSMCTFQYLGHRHWVLSLDWMHVGYTILSSSKSSAVHVWRVPCEQNQLDLQSSTKESFSRRVSDATHGQIGAHSAHSSSDKNPSKQLFARSNLTPNVSESPCVATAITKPDDFSEFDGVRIFMEREEREITQVSSAFKASDQSSGPGQYLRLATNEATKPAEKTYTTCHIASVSIELTDASFLWKTKDTTKQYASNVRFLGTESTFLLSIENESLAYDAENCILTSLFQGHTDKINAVAFNSSLDVCFTASSDKFVKAWDISRAPKFDLLEHSSLAAITTIVIGHQQSDLFNDFMDCTFFFGCSDGSLGANKCQKRSVSEPLTSIDYSLSGVFYKHSYGISALAYFRSYKVSFPDTVASCDMNGGIMLWNATERKFLRALINTRSITIVASHFFLPAAAAGEETHLNLFTITGDGFCVVWDAENGSAIRFVNLPVSTVSHVQLCTDCFFCVLRHTGVNAFTLFDYATLANLGLLKPQLFTSENETLTALTLSIGGERCAVGSSTGDICLFEPHSQHMVLVGKHHKKEVNILLWTRFMNRVVSTAADMTLAIWDGFSTPNGSESEFSHGGFPVFAPIVFNKLDVNLTIIQECANVPWLIATMDEKCASCIWNIATATAICKIAVHNSSPAMAFFGKALCFGNSKENIPIVFSLENTDTLHLVRGKSSLLTDANDLRALDQERKELRKWTAARLNRA